LVKILKFFDVHPGSRIRDGKNSDPGSGIQDGKNLDPGSRIQDGKNSDPGSRIQGQTYRITKTGNFVAKVART
jgi:hypothetical protein